MSLNATELAAASAAAKVCFVNPLVLQKLQVFDRWLSVATDYGLQGYEKGIYRYGGPGILVGMCVPVVVLNAMIAFWRVSYHVNIRALLLAVASVINLVDVGNLMVGRSIPYSQIAIKAHLSLLIIFGTIKLALVVAASSWRFSAVITKERSRKIFTTSYMVYSLLWAGLGVGVGMHDVLTKQQASREFWAICAVLPFTYMVPAVFCFTKTLARTESQTRSSVGPNAQRIKFLRISNNILVAIAFICAATLICVTQTLDSFENYFVVPTQVFMGSVWLLSEDCFELLAIWQGAMSAESVSAAAAGMGVSSTNSKAGGALRASSAVHATEYSKTEYKSAARLPSTGGGGPEGGIIANSQRRINTDRSSVLRDEDSV
ncbi:hypothetical protein HDU89_001005 [Geranomyces variabilis]|nr:hypothetical protein HDU89_001005 [Geranomyces variabilis]